MSKTNPGNLFEDFRVGQVIEHATPPYRHQRASALYGARSTPTRFAIASSDAVRRRPAGCRRAPVEELIGFHIAFGKTVPDVSLNAVANLGYAECRFHQPVRPGDTLRARSEVIGVKQNSSGKTGVVWVRSTATNQHGETAIDWARWVMVRKADLDAPAPDDRRARAGRRPSTPADLIVPRRSGLSPATTSPLPANPTASTTTRSERRSTTWTA
ncbi:MAG: MaoC family dehydratase [Acidimicrobiales bacterium]|nr:MaoC family dehydratase [Acidimicrobiales bacterium]